MKAVVFHGVGDIRLDDVKEPKIQDAPTPSSASPLGDLRHRPAHGPRHHARHEARHHPRPRGRRRRRGGGRRTCATSGRRPRRHPFDHRLRLLLLLPQRLLRAVRPRQPQRRRMPAPHSSAARPRPAPFHGLQAEFARVPFANVGWCKLPEEVRDDQAIYLRHLPDRLLRGRPGRDRAGRHRGRVRLRAGRAVRHRQCQAAGRRPGVRRRRHPDAAGHGPRRVRRSSTSTRKTRSSRSPQPDHGIGADRAIDAVGIDAQYAAGDRLEEKSKQMQGEFHRQLKMKPPRSIHRAKTGHPGDVPSQVLVVGGGSPLQGREH